MLKGSDKGKVEGLVGLIRRNYLVPIPHAASFAALNAQLLVDCRRRFDDRLRGHDETIGERLLRDLACFHDLPASPYDACDKKPGRVSSLSLVRYYGTDYSVPTAYGHREVLIRGYVDTVVISCGADVIARHVRSYEREDFVFDPLPSAVTAKSFLPPDFCSGTARLPGRFSEGFCLRRVHVRSPWTMQLIERIQSTSLHRHRGSVDTRKHAHFEDCCQTLESAEGTTQMAGTRPSGMLMARLASTSFTRRYSGGIQMKFRPLHDRVVVRRLDAEEKTAGGIIIPDTAKEKPMEGKIVAVGPGTRNEQGQLVALDVKAGDRILFGKWSGTEVKIDGEDLLIMKESDVMGIIEGGVPKKKAA